MAEPLGDRQYLTDFNELEKNERASQVANDVALTIGKQTGEEQARARLHNSGSPGKENPRLGHPIAKAGSSGQFQARLHNDWGVPFVLTIEIEEWSADHGLFKPSPDKGIQREHTDPTPPSEHSTRSLGGRTSLVHASHRYRHATNRG